MSKIVVFDSGFGGLTVLKELRKAMPDEEYIYYGDSANAPYGEKSPEELLKLGSAICRKMTDSYDVKCFVIACNTTTSEVWKELTDRYSASSFVGIEPALKWAVEENPGKNILVLATTATINGKRLRKRYEELKEQADITLLAAPKIVPFVESCNTGGQEFKDYLEELLKPYKDKVDCVVLGCTHFPFVKNEIRESIGRNVKFYDAAVTVAGEVKGLLSGCGFGPSGLVPVSFADGYSREQYAEAANTEARDSYAGADKAADGCSRKTECRPAEKQDQEQVIYLNSDPAKVELEKRLLSIYSELNTDQYQNHEYQ